MKVLIAEDDSISRLMLQAMLVEWGYEVTAVADGAEAWRILQSENAPRLVILDWVMPRMDGVEVCRRVRARPSQEPAHIILLTSRDDKADIVAGLHSGASDYVTKPFDRDELQARVRDDLCDQPHAGHRHGNRVVDGEDVSRHLPQGKTSRR